MKQLWVRVDPWDKKLVTTALESGADAVWVPQGRTEEVKALGLITVVAPDGDLVPGKDVQEVAISSTADEAEVIRLARQGPVVVHTPTGPSFLWKTWWLRVATSSWRSAMRTGPAPPWGCWKRGWTAWWSPMRRRP